MGLFSIGKVNKLLVETERQIAKISNLHDYGASPEMMQNAVNELRQLTAQIHYHFTDSSMAREAVYTFLGSKCRSWDIVYFLRNTIKEMEEAIRNGVV